MKTWGAWEKAVRFTGLTVVGSSLILLAYFQGSITRMDRAELRVPSATASEASGLRSAKENPRLIEAYGKLPLRFEENEGQTAQEVRYVSRGAGYELFLTSQEAVLALRAPIPHDLSPRNRFATLRAIREALRTRRMTAVRMRFEGANPAARISAAERLLTRTNYFIGNDRSKWHTNVPSFARVKYAEIYPGVDLVFYGKQRRLEYDLIVAPGSDPKSVRLSLEGPKRLRVDSHGDLIMSVLGGEVVLQKPVVYQMVKGERHKIAGSYVLEKGHQVSFSIPTYDRSEPLILDPVLNYSTYLGGTADDQGLGIAVDSAGDAFVAGTTFSTDFPTTANAFNKGPLASNAMGEAFVTEMNPTGTAEIYSTYLAGSIGESAMALALDSTGKIYITGQTLSSDFPTTSNALKQSPNPGNLNVGTSFVTKLDPTQSGASQLVYSSYLGGTNGSVAAAFRDFGQGIVVDANGIVYVAGYTDSTPSTTVTSLPNFPIVNGFQTTLNTSNGNGFLAKIDTTKSGSNSLIYSTYIGGTGANAATRLLFGDAAFGVAIDTTGNAYVTGATSSTDFPTNGTTAAFQTAVHAGNTQGTAFVTKIDTMKTGSTSLIYSTYLGGEIFEEGFAIALGPNNVAYVTGTTDSLMFPTMPAGAFQTIGHTTGNAFVSLIDTGKSGSSSLTYSTFLGGSKPSDNGNAIRVDSQGNAYVAGATGSNTDFPLTPGALQPVYPGAAEDGFVSKLNPGGNGKADLVYSTYFGGSGGAAPNQDQALAIALDSSNPPNVFITGETFSAAKFPVFPMGAFQTTLKGTSDAFVAKLTLVPTLVVSPTSLNFGTILIPNTSPAQTVTLTNNTSAAIAFTSAVVNGSPAAANAADYMVTNSCSGSIPSGANNTCTVSVTFKPTVVGAETATLQLTDSDSTSPQNIALTGSGTNTPPDFTVTAPATATVKDGSSVNFTVTVTPMGGFSSPVTLTCTEPAALTLSTCTPVPTTVMLTDGVTPQTSTVTVTTTALMVPPTRIPTPPAPWRQIVPLVLALLLLFLLPKTERLRTRVGMVTAMLLLFALAGCSGPPKPHTIPGTYNLTITGTAGATTHTATVALTVN